MTDDADLDASELRAALALLGIRPGDLRARRLRRVRQPRQLQPIGRDLAGRERHLAVPAARAWARMRAAAAVDGVDLQVVSAYRSVRYQLGILRHKLDRGQPLAEILRVNAIPGYSEHHSGRALDLSTPGFAPLEEEFEHSPAFAWLRQHAGRFGFRLSYPRGNAQGMAYEPWHWCWHRAKR